MQKKIHQTERVNSLLDMLDQAVKKHPDSTAFLYKDENGSNRSKTYTEFYQDVITLGNHFLKKKLKRSKIIVIGENSYEWVVIYFATVISDNIIVPLDKELPLEELSRLVKLIDSSVFVYSDKLKDKISMLRFQNDVELIKTTEVSTICSECNCTAISIDYDLYQTSSVIFTSGTTGVSRGVMLSQNNILWAIFESNQSIDFHGLVCVFLPLHHVFTTIDNLLGPFHKGSPLAICSNIMNFANDMEKYKPEVVFVVPALLETVYKKIWWKIQSDGIEKKVNKAMKIADFYEQFGLHLRKKFFRQIHNVLGGNIKYIVCGGAYLDEKYSVGFEKFGITVIVGYGITECTGGIVINRAETIRHGSVGLPFECAQLWINIENESDTEGEILIKSPMNMLGYYQDRQATLEAFDGEWFKTGDIGHVDEDGFLYITGRNKNLIILGNGKNVSPEELEKEIYRLPGVKETIVSGVNNRIQAEIYPEENVLEIIGIEESELYSYYKAKIREMNSRFENYKRITEVSIRTEEFPKTSSGKIKRASLFNTQKEELNQPYAEPITKEEEYLCDVFAEILKKPRIGAEDNFFSSGGDSLAVLELCAALQTSYMIEPMDVYENPTPRGLANHCIFCGEVLTEEKDVKVNEYIPKNTNEKVGARHKAGEILLTGATGYLGSHLLKELLESGYTVTCLVRNKERLRNICEFYFDKELVNSNKLKIVTGDISSPLLGLSSDTYEELLHRIDTVVHAAALVKHIGNYDEHKKTNIDGTRNVIDFCEKSNAMLYHTSTVYVSGFAKEEKAVLDEFHLDIGQSIDGNVYFKSKYHAEEMVLEAMSRGLKVNIMRIGNLTWRKDGVFQINANENGFLSRIYAIKKLGACPKTFAEEWMDFTAVDDCAKAYTVLIAEGVENRIWHLISDKQTTILQIMKGLGFEPKTLEDEEFKEAAMKNRCDKDISVLAMYYRMMQDGLNTEIAYKITVDYLKECGFEWNQPYVTKEYMGLMKGVNG